MTAPLHHGSRLHIPIRFTKAVLGAHGLTGILFAWAIYLVCFSGTLCVLADEFLLWEQPRAPIVETASQPLLVDVAARGYAVARALGPVTSFYVSAPSPTLPQLTVSARVGGVEHGWSADAQGRLTPRAGTPWTEFLRQHHYDFNLPAPFGDYLVGVLGTLLLAALISGTLAHRRILKDAFRLRWGGSRRLSNADLHNRIGVWALPFHLIVSLTGSLLGLAGLIIGVLALIAYQGDTGKATRALFGPQATADDRPAPLPDPRPMFDTIEARAPGTRTVLVVFDRPGKRGQQVSIYTAAPGYLTRAEAWTFAPDGRLIHKAGYTDGTLGMRIYGMVTPLHFGTYGGLPLKIVYVLLGASLTSLMASGLAIWLARRREQGRAAPRRERLWAALVWGQPLAFALSALLSLVAGLAPIPVFWLVTATTAVAAPFGPDRERVWRWMRIAAGGMAVLLGIVHLAMRGAGLGLPIDIALMLLGGWTVIGMPRGISSLKAVQA